MVVSREEVASRIYDSFVGAVDKVVEAIRRYKVGGVKGYVPREVCDVLDAVMKNKRVKGEDAERRVRRIYDYTRLLWLIYGVIDKVGVRPINIFELDEDVRFIVKRIYSILFGKSAPERFGEGELLRVIKYGAGLLEDKILEELDVLKEGLRDVPVINGCVMKGDIFYPLGEFKDNVEEACKRIFKEGGVFIGEHVDLIDSMIEGLVLSERLGGKPAFITKEGKLKARWFRDIPPMLPSVVSEEVVEGVGGECEVELWGSEGEEGTIFIECEVDGLRELERSEVAVCLLERLYDVWREEMYRVEEVLMRSGVFLPDFFSDMERKVRGYEGR